MGAFRNRKQLFCSDPLSSQVASLWTVSATFSTLVCAAHGITLGLIQKLVLLTGCYTKQHYILVYTSGIAGLHSELLTGCKVSVVVADFEREKCFHLPEVSLCKSK